MIIVRLVAGPWSGISSVFQAPKETFDIVPPETDCGSCCSYGSNQTLYQEADGARIQIGERDSWRRQSSGKNQNLLCK